ncbi:MAG: hypothetical protein JWM82_275 [Myxococcales bacterium]|nr:hypothetical protein [Myxococcales bacterium]
MRTSSAFLLASALGMAVGLHGASASAKGKKKGGGEGAAPTASSAEVNKLKAVRLGDPKAGTFKWGMKAEDILAQVQKSIDAKYTERIEKASQDPGKQQRIRDEKDREFGAVKKSYTKFEGNKTGWDVSIIGSEFEQNTGEAVIVTKEDIWTRYFFFFEDGLYKMFLAFNKDALEGKSFEDFGKGMEAKYGHAKEVYRDEKIKGGVRHVLDHYEWSAGVDKLRLVDRSEFYGVYCLVLYDGGVASRLAERRKIVNPQADHHDSLVEAVTHKDDNGRDSNDNIIDRLTGKEVKKPGEDDGKHADIVVPSPTHGGPSAAEVNGRSTGSSPSAAPEKEPASKKKGASKKNDALDGLEL